MRFFAGLADKIYGRTFTGIPTHVIYTRKEPIGVVALISPWNFPFMMMIWKMMPALAAGNCVISKPSEITPLSLLFFGQLVKEAGFPPGVINIIPGYGHTVGNYLSHHHSIGKISFTGSTPVGRLVMKASADTNLKKVSLELGGKSPIIVFSDAEMNKAVEEVYLGAFFNSS
jgi:aldehyde dehydrogenase (NAD+)